MLGWRHYCFQLGPQLLHVRRCFFFGSSNLFSMCVHAFNSVSQFWSLTEGSLCVCARLGIQTEPNRLKKCFIVFFKSSNTRKASGPLWWHFLRFSLSFFASIAKPFNYAGEKRLKKPRNETPLTHRFPHDVAIFFCLLHCLLHAKRVVYEHDAN